MPLSRRSMFAVLAGASMAPAVASAAPPEVNSIDTGAWCPVRGRRPLRFSPDRAPTDKDGHGHLSYASMIRHAAIFVDGVKVEHVTYADEIDGYVEVLDRWIGGKQPSRKEIRGFVHVKDSRKIA